MMDPAHLRTVAGAVAGALALGSFVPYLASTWRGRTRPNRASWWIWTVVGVMIASSHYAGGARRTVWVALSYVIGPLAAAILSIRRGEGGFSRFDRACLAAAALSLGLWLASGTPLVALAINVVIDLLGALPTIRKTWRDPESESLLAWSIGFAGNTLNLVAVEHWTFAGALYPIYLFLIAGTITLLAARRRRRLPG